MQYTYNSITTQPDLNEIHTEVANSAMADKGIVWARWDEDTQDLMIQFSGTLSGADKTILDGIVTALGAQDLTFSEELNFKWNGTWVSQNYVANDVVEYNGSSYICILDTVSSEVPTNTTYWDVLAQKGDAGVGVTSVDISIDRNISNGAYEIADRFIFKGTTALGTPTNIKAILHINGATDGSIRIYDVTNAQTICELTGFTEANPTIKDLGTLSNLPAGEALFEIQLKRTGTGGQSSDIHGLSIYF